LDYNFGAKQKPMQIRRFIPNTEHFQEFRILNCSDLGHF
jgi:hypothetical protein